MSDTRIEELDRTRGCLGIVPKALLVPTAMSNYIPSNLLIRAAALPNQALYHFVQKVTFE